MKWTGLTGGIATGKSTVKKLLQGRGVPVIDADEISHNLTKVGEIGYEKVLSHFGNQILNTDRTLNRTALGQLVFSDKKQKQKLEEILHPLIQADVKIQRETLEKSGASLCFYDVPLLFEKKLQTQFDHTVLVWCDPKMQLERLMLRNHLSASEAKLRIANQMPLIDKVKLADRCLDNSGDVDDLKYQVDRLLKSYGNE